MRAAAEDSNLRTSVRAGVRPLRWWRWVFLTLTLAFNTFATYYYLAIRTPVDLAVTTAAIAAFWAMWVAAVTVTLVAHPASRADRLIAGLAPACVVVAGALYFIA